MPRHRTVTPPPRARGAPVPDRPGDLILIADNPARFHADSPEEAAAVRRYEAAVMRLAHRRPDHPIVAERRRALGGSAERAHWFHPDLVAIFVQQVRRHPACIASAATPSARPLVLVLLVEEELRRRRAGARRWGRSEIAGKYATWLRLLGTCAQDARDLAAQCLGKACFPRPARRGVA